MTRIAAIGEGMIELAPTEGEGQFRIGYAGDTMNTAWYLRGLLPAEDQVDYVTAVGTDAVSDGLLAFLDDAGIGTEHVARRADRTLGLYMVHLRGGERSFSYWRGQSAARTLAQGATLGHALDCAHMAYVSGITLAILPREGRARLLSHLRRFRARGGTVVLDPNLRPRLWESPAAMTEAVTGAASTSDIVLPSFEDEATWFGDHDAAATARRYVGCGARTVVVKDGPRPILAWEAGASFTRDPEPVARVVDTTAAGDSFNAGYLASRIRGGTMEDALALAVSLAARVVQAHGALVDGAAGASNGRPATSA